MPTPLRDPASGDMNPQPASCEAAVLTTAPLCCPKLQIPKRSYYTAISCLFSDCPVPLTESFGKSGQPWSTLHGTSPSSCMAE